MYQHEMAFWCVCVRVCVSFRCSICVRVCSRGFLSNRNGIRFDLRAFCFKAAPFGALFLASNRGEQPPSREDTALEGLDFHVSLSNKGC